MTLSGPLSRLGDPAAMHTAVAALLDMACRATAAFGGSTLRLAASREALRVDDIAAAERA